MPDQDPLYRKKIDIWQKHQTPKSEHMCSSGCTKTSFAIKYVVGQLFTINSFHVFDYFLDLLGNITKQASYSLGRDEINSKIGTRDIFF